MMRQMRENTKVILWIVVAAFVVTIFAVWGLDLQTGPMTGQTQGVVGKVNGVTISPQAYQSMINQLSQQYRAASPDGQLSAAQQELLRQQAWENIVTNVLTEQEIKKLGITVSDEEVLAYLRNSPPPEVRQYFVDDNGNFDFAAYQAALNNPEADWTAVEQLARQRIPLIKLNQYLLAQVHVGHDEIRRRYEADNIRMVADYVAFPIANESVANYTPSDEEIRGYYDAHADEFARPETAVIEYVRIPIEPTPADREDTAWLINQIRQQILDGEDFATVARTYSEGRTAQAGGDVGFVRPDQRDPAIMMAAQNLEPGELSGPVFTEEGVYLIKVVETRQNDAGSTEYHLNEIELPMEAGPETLDSLNALATDVREFAGTGTLEAAAAEYGLQVEKTAAFSPNMPIAGLGFSPVVSRFAFSNEVGTLSNVIADDDNYYVCRVLERNAATTAPLDEVRDTISSKLVEDRQRELTMREAEAFFRALRTSPITWQEALDKYGHTAAPTDTFRVADRVGPSIPPYSAFAYAALDAPELYNRRVSPPIESGGIIYVIHVRYRSELDPSALQAQADAIRDRLFQQKVQEYIAWWYEDLREKSQIEDYRGAL